MLDTNILIYFMNRKPGFDRIARHISGRSVGELRLSAITYAELRFGIEQGKLRAKNEAALLDLMEYFQIDDFPSGAATDFRKIKTALMKNGKPIGPYDMLIAAHARHVGATLVTNNDVEFRRVPALSLQNWLEA